MPEQYPTLLKHNKIPNTQNKNSNTLDLSKYFETCKEAENIIHNQEISQEIETETQMTEVMVLAGKDIKTTITNILHMFKNVV